MLKQRSSTSAFNSPCRSLGLGSSTSILSPPQPQSEWYSPGAGRSPGVSAGSTPARPGGRGKGEGREQGKTGGDWLIPVAGAWSLRLLSALLRQRSGRRQRAPSGPIRRQPAPAGVAAIGQTPVTKRDKGRRGKEKKGGKKKKESANDGY